MFLLILLIPSVFAAGTYNDGACNTGCRFIGFSRGHFESDGCHCEKIVPIELFTEKEVLYLNTRFVKKVRE